MDPFIFIKKIVPLSFIFLFILPKALAQEISVELGKSEIGPDEYYSITAKIENGKIEDYSGFPQLEGFEKAGTSSSSSTSIVNGQIKSSHSIAQNYVPKQKGEYRIPAFSMQINGREIQAGPHTVKVSGSPGSRQSKPSANAPFRQFFGDQEEEKRSNDFVDVKEDAFLALSTDKDEVFVGEGFTATLAFYVSRKNRAPLQFHELGQQLTDILKKLKPANCWEENFNIDNITGKNVTINGEPYLQYKIYKATFFPLNLKDINFSPVGLKMIKYKVSRNPSFFGNNRKEGFKTFYSQEKTVAVKELPEHPLKNSVAVGSFELEEDLTKKSVNTGQSVGYTFKIKGKGNITAIEKPTVYKSQAFDIYSPNVQQNISKIGNVLRGSKSFDYYLVAQEPGNYYLEDLFEWIYFDPSKEKYDTLQSRMQVNVTGESRKDEHIMASDQGVFYEKINRASNNLQDLQDNNAGIIFLNIMILIMLLLTAIITFKK